MRISTAVAIFLALLAPGCQTQSSAPSAVAPTSECDRLLKAVPTSNTMAIFNATGICAEEGRNEDVNLLVMLGQVRAVTDIAILAPVDRMDPAMVEIAGLIYAGAGGLGFDEVYRDPAAVDRIVASADAAVITFTPGYDPGWAYKPTSKVDVYDALADAMKQQRIWQMRNYALLMQNDAYYEAHLAHRDLRAQNPIFEAGTPAFDEEQRLSALMAEASASIQQFPPPDIALPFDRLNEPDPDAAFRHVATGFNGPEEYDVTLFCTRAEAEASWLANAYTHDELAVLLDAIDFETHVLAAYSIGRQTNASGKITVLDFAYDSGLEGYSIGIRVGVLPETCEAPELDSYPFVLATTPRGATTRLSGWSRSNFPDACGPPASSQPASPK